jgi:hypothetical protein
MNSKIVDAIRGSRLLRVNYKGDTRVVEPFCYGVNKLGHEVLRAFQVEGVSNSGQSFGWKMFTVDDISSAEILERTFLQARPQYNPNDKDMMRIIAAWKSVSN